MQRQAKWKVKAFTVRKHKNVILRRQASIKEETSISNKLESKIRIRDHERIHRGLQELVKNNSLLLNLTKPALYELRVKFTNLKEAETFKVHLIIRSKDEAQTYI